MVIETRAIPSTNAIDSSSKAQITIFHCFNAINNVSFLDSDRYDIKTLKIPCSSMIREVVLLKAFEAGADAVLVLACPEGSCHYIEGNIRARKRVSKIKYLLDEIGIDGRRLNIFNIQPDDKSAVSHIIDQTMVELASLGHSPAALIR